jgi:hypothetical protein
MHEDDQILSSGYFTTEQNFSSRSGQWKPSIHIPKAPARIWLQIINIRAHRSGWSMEITSHLFTDLKHLLIDQRYQVAP